MPHAFHLTPVQLSTQCVDILISTWRMDTHQRLPQTNFSERLSWLMFDVNRLVMFYDQYCKQDVNMFDWCQERLPIFFLKNVYFVMYTFNAHAIMRLDVKKIILFDTVCLDTHILEQASSPSPYIFTFHQRCLSQKTKFP